jgi:hypothetical protein
LHKVPVSKFLEGAPTNLDPADLEAKRDLIKAENERFEKIKDNLLNL